MASQTSGDGENTIVITAIMTSLFILENQEKRSYFRSSWTNGLRHRRGDNTKGMGN